MAHTRYVMYVRKSTSDDGKQLLSIPAQERELRSLARAKGLTLVGEPVRETKSAKEPGRPEFAKVMTMLQTGKADGILCWHLNRLARNPIDGGSIMWSLGTGTIREILTPERSFTGSGDDKLMMSIIFGMATKDIDDLRLNIRRGNLQALTQGLWPGKPKFGYTRDRSTMRLVEDPARFSFVREAFRLRRQGVPIADILERARTEWMLTTVATRTTGGKLISLSHLYRMFRDPFYAGMMERKEGSFPGSHPPAVSWNDFQDVQEQMKRLGPSEPRPKTLFFPYRGLLTCGACTSVVTAENTTNRFGTLYRYYHCCRKQKKYNFCPEPSLEEKAIEEQLRRALARVTLPEGIADAVVDELGRIREEIEEVESKAEQNILEQLSSSDEMLRNLRHLAAQGRISPEELDEDRRSIHAEQVKLRARLERADPVRGFIEPLQDGLSYAVLAKQRFEEGDGEKKREVCQTVFSNLVLKQKTLLVEAKFPVTVHPGFCPRTAL